VIVAVNGLYQIILNFHLNSQVNLMILEIMRYGLVVTVVNSDLNVQNLNK